MVAMGKRTRKDGRDVLLFTVIMLLLIVVIFFSAGYLLGRSLI
jgi:hypothetical protein